MRLAELRKITIRKNARIRFTLANGMECVVNEHGVAQIPALRAIPELNLEMELAAVERFVLEPVAAGGKNARAEALTRSEVEALGAVKGHSGNAPEDHDE